MQFAILGSGSRGNASLIETAGACVMVDCGFSMKETVSRLAKLQREPSDITAILVTHEHTDHIRGVGAFARKHSIPVYATRGTARSNLLGELPDWQAFNPEQAIVLNDMHIQAFPVPHDAREPCQFVFSDGDRRFAQLTDVGSSTSHIEQVLSGCHAMILECNHDPTMLAESSYPESLKRRISGMYGHLSNGQAADILAAIDTDKLQQVVLAHLSEQNNQPALAKHAVSTALGCDPEWLEVAEQDATRDWRTV
ncbi:MAG: MBL fold metallo-hydrolase [Gammaproteobacteria bacterium]|nr:MBL fold metallo-hydrolase [Gammaproteobacteria bacterium]MDH5651084.1 MBL fold metallo-hydrolase [Gammaproteobacteria bacterium]